MVNLHPAHSAIDAQIASCRMLLYISDVRHLSHPLDCGFNCTRHGRRRKQALNKAARSSSDLAIKGGNIKSFVFDNCWSFKALWKPQGDWNPPTASIRASVSNVYWGIAMHSCSMFLQWCEFPGFVATPQGSGGTVTWINELLSYLDSFIYQPFDELWLSLCRITMQFAILPQLPFLEESQPGCFPLTWQRPRDPGEVSHNVDSPGTPVPLRSAFLTTSLPITNSPEPRRQVAI